MALMNNASRSKTPLIVGSLLGVAVVGAIIAWVTGVGRAPANQEAEGNPDGTTTPVESLPATKYQDGTYSATGTYVSPAGSEMVDVSLTITGDVVTNSSFQGKASNPTSVRMQSQFAQGYRTFVVGKNVDELDLTVVNGSSLTPKGFEDAVMKIKAQAAVAPQS